MEEKPWYVGDDGRVSLETFDHVRKTSYQKTILISKLENENRRLSDKIKDLEEIISLMRELLELPRPSNLIDGVDCT